MREEWDFRYRIQILLDLFASRTEPLRHKELPCEFRTRFAGTSKLDSMVAWEYFMMLLDKLCGGVVPARFIAFSLVGLVGVAVHLAVLSALFKGLSTTFIAGQVTATLVAMTSNFALNNLLTYRDMRLRGVELLRGWISFAAASGVGALANVGIASYLFERDQFWLVSALARHCRRRGMELRGHGSLYVGRSQGLSVGGTVRRRGSPFRDAAGVYASTIYSGGHRAAVMGSHVRELRQMLDGVMRQVDTAHDVGGGSGCRRAGASMLRFSLRSARSCGSRWRCSISPLHIRIPVCIWISPCAFKSCDSSRLWR